MDFYSLLDRAKVKKQVIRLTLLSFDEKEIRTIQGSITNGSLNVNGSAAVRRTISLTMTATSEENDLTNIDNLISLNKKIKVEVGYYNPFPKLVDTYGEIVWFKCGVFVISTATITSNATSLTISIQGKDKMSMLDGTVGGTFPASVTFHEIYNYDKEGNLTIEYPTIHQIIQEAVNHYGGEELENIIISDIDEEAKMLVKYIGDTPIWFKTAEDHSTFMICADQPEGYYKAYEYGEDIGYMVTDFTYPSELVFNAGGTVSGLLDQICKTLGNYEYFYDVNGKFIFQEIKNYLNTSYTPITDLSGADYIKNFSDSKYAYAFDDDETVVSFNNNPKYDNIKNDFIVWGQRTSTSGLKTEIRFHLAVDEKPNIDLAGQYMWEVIDEDENLIRYEYTETSTVPSVGEYTATLFSIPCDEWREELYRQALERALSDGEEGYYDDELIAEWRKLYDPLYGGWLVDDPQTLDYWLDFIDSPTLGQYSVNMIGRRTKVVNDTNIKTIYNMGVPDVVFVENTGDLSELYELFTKYKSNGQDFCLLQPEQMSYFSISSTQSSCYDKIRELLYTYLVYNSTITITCLPRYYFEPNQLVYVRDKNSGIRGSYVISQFSLPLQYSGTMSITATEALTRV